MPRRGLAPAWRLLGADAAARVHTLPPRAGNAARQAWHVAAPLVARGTATMQTASVPGVPSPFDGSGGKQQGANGNPAFAAC